MTRILVDVLPLKAQIANPSTENVPDKLKDWFWGNAASCDEQVFAVLDAAKIINLVPMIETSGLEHRCLFKGTSAAELGDVAPWLVRLEEAHQMTSNLFTSGTAPWEMWDRAPGIFLKSTAQFDEIWRHLRKFTKLFDPARNRWVFFRFYDPIVIAPLLQSFDEDQMTDFFGPATMVLAQNAHGQVVVCEEASDAA